MTIEHFPPPKSDSALHKELPDSSAAQEDLGLAQLFLAGLDIPPKNAYALENNLIQGLQFYQKFHQTRLQIAFEVFTEDMKKALYEVLYFLHVNDSRFDQWKYRGYKVQHLSGITQESSFMSVANLYLPDTPSGVRGIQSLPAIYKQSFHDYIQQEFGGFPEPMTRSAFNSIVSVSSLGSVGTVGHKKLDSDLDLQILYELQSFFVNPKDWTDARLRKAFHIEISYWIKRMSQRRSSPIEATDQRFTDQHQLKAEATQQVSRTYPNLYRILFESYRPISYHTIMQNKHLKQALIHEMIQLIKQNAKISQQIKLQEQEKRLHARINRIQKYVQEKFPKIEIHLFACDTESFRKGQHGTTLESKEASGTAYELILNYEVLMPGIQLLSNIPTDFIISREFNSSKAYYERIIDYIRVRCLSMYNSVSHALLDLGATPALKPSYLYSHIGAVYWESFKAASGNLHKALLNLLRIEMLYHASYLTTMSELIKYPDLLDQHLMRLKNITSSIPAKQFKRGYGLQLKQLIHLEEFLPALRMDPWWLKFKALKIFYIDPDVSIDTSERRRLSRTIDLCFALHIKLSDAFTLENQSSQTYREKFLLKFLALAFPERTQERRNLEMIFIGEITVVSTFERDLKTLFSNALGRIHRIAADHNITDSSNQAEFEIWYHYYQQNFETGPDEVSRNILAHLKVPRAQIRIEHKKNRRKGNWLFYVTAHQTNHVASAQEDTPTEVNVLCDDSFLKGLAHCILNGYYGLYESEDSKVKKTQLELVISNLHLDNHYDTHWSVIDSEILTRLADKLIRFFPYRYTSYLDCVNLEKKITDIFFCMNLFKFGQLSILYRNNLQNWYVEDFSHDAILTRAYDYYDDPKKLMSHSDVHFHLDYFFRINRINLGDPQVNIGFWYNPLSVEHLNVVNLKKREDSLMWLFQEIVESRHKHSALNKLSEKTSTENNS